MMGSSLIDSYTWSEIEEKRKIEVHLHRSQSVYHTIEICNGELLSSGSGTYKCDLFSDACLRLGMLRNCVEIPQQSFG